MNWTKEKLDELARAKSCLAAWRSDEATDEQLCNPKVWITLIDAATDLPKILAALEWYADKKNHSDTFASSGKEQMFIPSAVRLDLGEKAREALQAIKEVGG